MSKMDKARIGELGKTYSGLSGKTKEDFGTGQPFITYMNVFSSGKIDPAMMDRVQINRGERQNNAVYGDIFFTTSSETVEDVGTSSVMLYEPPVATYLNSFCFGFRLHNFDRLHPEFAAYLLRGQAARKAISDLGQGSTRYNLPKTVFLERVVLEFPPLPVQRKIARILTTLDNLIEKTEALIAKYQAIKQGMMHDLFTRGVDSSGQLRPTQQQAPDLYKQSELGWIPKEWGAFPLVQFLSYISYGFTNPMPETEEGPWMVTAANVKGGFIDYESCRHTSTVAYNTLLTKKSRPNIGDILLTKDGTLGRLAIVDRPDICINQSVAVLRPKEEVNANFLKHLLETPLFQQKMLDDAGGSTIKHIYITVVDKMLIPAPSSSDEQSKISDIAANLDAKIAAERASLDKCKATKSGLMQDLLTGRVRVKVDEAEEVAAHA